MKRFSDFRSDTVTRPSAAMRRAMAEAEVADDVLDGDPTVAELERSGAQWLGKQAALFVPSGTMANQIALGAWTRPGQDLIAERGAHVLRYEGGAAGYLHGLQSTTLVGEKGALDLAELRSVIQSGNDQEPPTGLICVEQTHMGSGGRVLPFEHLQAVHALAAGARVPVHMDGARLANAVVASGRPAREWASLADSVSFCFSKGLGAPVGSLISGDADFIGRAKWMRKRLGGAMRQAGVIAAAALLALRENVERLAEDHALARELAALTDAVSGLSSPPAEVETNLVLVEVDPQLGSADELSNSLAEQCVLVLPLGPTTLRFVTHLDVDPGDVERLGDALQRCCS